MNEFVNQWRIIIQAWLYPPTCVLCGDPGSDDRDLCTPCHRSLPIRPDACIRCGANLSAASHLICGACQRQPPCFDRTIAAFGYEEPVRHLIRGLKFDRRYAYGRLLGALLAERLAQLADERPQRIIPVPLHRARYRQRGFNHAAEIAREVARRLAIPIDTETARRVRVTRPQVGLSAEERKQNLRNAFDLASPLPARHVAILDDVVTTGATVNELARRLKKGGAQRVDVWACARADRSSPTG